MNPSKCPVTSRTLFGVRKLPARYGALVMPLLLSIFMTCVVSLISALSSIGLAPNLLHTWLSAWGLSWLVAYPVQLLVLPLVQRITVAIVERR